MTSKTPRIDLIPAAFSVLLATLFAFSAASKLATHNDALADFVRMDLLTPSMALAAYYLSITFELLVALSLLVRRSRNFGAWAGVHYLFFVSVLYLLEWYVHGSVPSCGCGLEPIKLPSSGWWLILRNLLLMVLLVYVGLIRSTNKGSREQSKDDRAPSKGAIFQTAVSSGILITMILHLLVLTSERETTRDIKTLEIAQTETGNL